MDNAIIRALRERAARFTSLDSPQGGDVVDVAADVGAGFVPVVGTALSARDFERARREGDRLGMGLAAAGMLPVVGGVARAAGKARKGTRAAEATAEALRSVEKTGEVAKPANPVKNYGISHRPMTVEGGAARLHDLLPSFGEDIYGKNALQYFGSGDKREQSILRTLQALRGKPEETITIYRGVPDKNTAINPGDWVTLDPRVAADYGNVISMKVPASHVTSWPDSLMEFGYYPDFNIR
jgi:hypothetical protein